MAECVDECDLVCVDLLAGREAGALESIQRDRRAAARASLFFVDEVPPPARLGREFNRPRGRCDDEFESSFRLVARECGDGRRSRCVAERTRCDGEELVEPSEGVGGVLECTQWSWSMALLISKS